MARLGSQALAGFYPASPLAIGQLVKHLYCRLPSPERPKDTLQIIDPCAGEGLAVRQIAGALGIPNGHVYCVELDAARTETIKENVPGCNIIGPASFMGGVMITGYSFGVAYVNPPFDHEYGGGRREEQAFCEKAHKLLAIHGVMVLVCPLKAFVGNRDFVEFFDSRFEDVSVYKFPDGANPDGTPIRPYNEIVVFGRKRRQDLPRDLLYKSGTLHLMQAQYNGYITLNSLPPLGAVQPAHYTNGNPSYDREADLRTFEVPPCWRPNTFKKITLTDDELVAEVGKSPLNRHLLEVTPREPDAPPLPLDKGHLGLMLASGKLDGPVEGPRGVHIVRGSSHKVEYHNKEASTSEENPDTGAVTTRDVFSQRPVTVIRCVDHRGVIWTHSNEPDEKALEDDARNEEHDLIH
jgi:hypothetical protein